MGTGESESSAMASTAASKASKKNLRTLMKTMLSAVPAESVEAQSRPRSSETVARC
jgi:hypothetical protein